MKTHCPPECKGPGSDCLGFCIPINAAKPDSAWVTLKATYHIHRDAGFSPLEAARKALDTALKEKE